MVHAEPLSAVQDLVAAPDDAATAPTPTEWTVETIHASHARFVWSSLSRLGVREPDLKDQLQEVFLVVHRRLDAYDRTTKVSSWLFGICLRVASEYRRQRRRRPEAPLDDAREPSAQGSQEDAVAARQARAALERVLDGLDPEKRAVFVMFEVESIPCADIADTLGVPVGTVYSRLHAARAQFQQALAGLRRENEGRP